MHNIYKIKNATLNLQDMRMNVLVIIVGPYIRAGHANLDI